MIVTDTHIHIYSEQFDADRDALVKKAVANGVARLYMPNIDAASIEPMLAAEAKFPGICIPMMGLHPCSVTAAVENELQSIRQWLDRRKFAAIGEIGIDLHWDKTTLPYQEIAFKTQVEWALEFELPIVIHSRKSLPEILAILKKLPRQPGGIFHCFSGSREEANQILSLGYKLGIGGVLTFKNAGVAEVVKDLSLSDMVLETDAPYLAPVPHRGKRNEPAYVLGVLRELAQLKGCPVEEVAEVTTATATAIFKAI